MKYNMLKYSKIIRPTYNDSIMPDPIIGISVFVILIIYLLIKKIKKAIIYNAKKKDERK